MTDYRSISELKRIVKQNLGTDEIAAIREIFPSLYGVNATSRRFWYQAALLSAQYKSKG